MKDCCDDHHAVFAPKVHSDGQKNSGKMNGDGGRGVAPPAKHTKGKMPSHLQPDHGPHK